MKSYHGTIIFYFHLINILPLQWFFTVLLPLRLTHTNFENNFCAQTKSASREGRTDPATHQVWECPHVKFALDFYFNLLFTEKRKKRKQRRHSSEIESINRRRHASDLGAHVLVWCGSHNRWSGKPRPLVGCSLFITQASYLKNGHKKKSSQLPWQRHIFLFYLLLFFLLYIEY